MSSHDLTQQQHDDSSSSASSVSGHPEEHAVEAPTMTRVDDSSHRKLDDMKSVHADLTLNPSNPPPPPPPFSLSSTNTSQQQQQQQQQQQRQQLVSRRIRNRNAAANPGASLLQ